MIVALLISFTVPTMLSLMHNVNSQIAQDKAEEIVEGIAATLEGMVEGGPGNVRMVSIPSDLPNGIVIMIGGGNGTLDSTRITWNADGDMGARYLREAVTLTESGDPISLSAGDTIRLECPFGSPGTIRVVRA
jgi:hypothetical protein